MQFAATRNSDNDTPFSTLLCGLSRQVSLIFVFVIYGYCVISVHDSVLYLFISMFFFSICYYLFHNSVAFRSTLPHSAVKLRHSATYLHFSLNLYSLFYILSTYSYSIISILHLWLLTASVFYYTFLTVWCDILPLLTTLFLSSLSLVCTLPKNIFRTNRFSYTNLRP